MAARVSLTLTVHRATNQIGGNCIELADGKGGRIILDVGRPLDAPNDATGLIAPTLDLRAPADGVLISHSHQDHYGLLEEIPASWPVFCGAPTAHLIQLTSRITGRPVAQDFRSWQSGRSTKVGAFSVTPYLTDHSAFDAHMLLIEIDGKRILYSGDFRRHGRKGKLVEAMMSKPPAGIDVLLLEGTNLGTDKPTRSEADLEDEFEQLFRQTKGRVFVYWSGQNIDRTVTLYRACVKAKRKLAVDLYTAEVLEVLGEFGKIPQPGWPAMRAVITRAFSKLYKANGNSAFVERLVPNATSARRMAEHPEEWVTMIRKSLILDFERNGVIPTPDDAWSFSAWSGYLANGEGETLQSWFDAGGARAAHIHTSGHASPADLREFARAIGARRLVPIHGASWDTEAIGFDNVHRLVDGEVLIV